MLGTFGIPLRNNQDKSYGFHLNSKQICKSFINLPFQSPSMFFVIIGKKLIEKTDYTVMN